MSKPVLFAGTRPYGRAENVSALFDAYKGEKKYVHVTGRNTHPDMESGKFDVLVIDDFPSVSPGKCIMIWHAIQGGKHIGYDQNHPYINNERVSKIDYIITAGHGSVPMWSQSTRMPEDRIHDLLPGYVFLYFEDPVTFPWQLRKVDRIIRCLRDTNLDYELHGSDQEFAEMLYKKDGVIGRTEVTETNGRFTIADETFRNLHAEILKVDRRNKRMKIEILFANNKVQTWVEYEIIQ